MVYLKLVKACIASPKHVFVTRKLRRPDPTTFFSSNLTHAPPLKLVKFLTCPVPIPDKKRKLT